MGVGITLGDIQSHVVTRVQSLRNDLAVLSCPVTTGSRSTGPAETDLLVVSTVWERGR